MVWQNKELGSFFNTEFIPFRVTPSDDAWKEMLERFEIRGTPTIVLLKPDGEELDRINGFDGAADFVAAVKDYLAGKNLLSTYIAEAEKNPDDVEANFKLAKKHTSRWDDDKAYPYYEKVIELDPDNALGHKPEATLRTAIHKLVSKDTPDPEPLKQFIAENTEKEFMVESYTMMSRYYQNQKDNEKAISLWEELLAKLPESPEVMNQYAYTVFSLRDESRYDRAKAEAEKALASGNADQLFLSHYNIIRYYRETGDNEMAVAMYSRAADAVPEEPFFKYGFGSIVLREKMTDKYDQAVQMIEAALVINEKNADYWATLAGIHFERGERQEAVKAQEQAVELAPNNPKHKENLEKYRGEENE